MAMTLAAAYPELWAAVAIHSAPPPRAATGTQDAFRAMQAATEVPRPAARIHGAAAADRVPGTRRLGRPAGQRRTPCAAVDRLPACRIGRRRRRSRVSARARRATSGTLLRARPSRVPRHRLAGRRNARARGMAHRRAGARVVRRGEGAVQRSPRSAGDDRDLAVLRGPVLGAPSGGPRRLTAREVCAGDGTRGLRRLVRGACVRRSRRMDPPSCQIYRPGGAEVMPRRVKRHQGGSRRRSQSNVRAAGRGGAGGCHVRFRPTANWVQPCRWPVLYFCA